MYDVYIITDECNRIVGALPDFDGTAQIPGIVVGKTQRGDAADFLLKGILNSRHVPFYKYVDGHIVERTQDEMDADHVPPVPVPDSAKRIEALEAAMHAIEEGIASV